MKLLIFLLALPAIGQALNLDEAYREAARLNENVVTTDENVVQAQENVKQAWGSLVPQISFSTQWMWQESVVGTGGTFSPSYNPLTKLTASQTLFQGYREYYGLRGVKSQLSGQELGREQAKLALLKSVAKAYLLVIQLERDRENAREQVVLLNREIKLLENWREIGRSQMTDVLTARSNLTAAEVVIEGVTQQIEVAREQFALATGLSADTHLEDPVATTPPVSDPKFNVEPLPHYLGLIGRRPDVRAAERAVESAESNLRVSRSNHIPSLAAVANRYLDRAGVTKDIHWDASLVLTIPIYAGGTTESKVRQSFSQVHQAELSLSLARRTAEEEIRQDVITLQSDLRLFELNTQNLKVNEQNYRENAKYLRLGLVPLLNEITALTNYTAAKRALDKNRYDLKNDAIQLRAAVAASGAEVDIQRF